MRSRGRRMRMPVAPNGLAKNGDEHWRNILQAIFRVRLFEERGVLLQLVSHLINDKGAAVRKRVMRFLQKRALFIDIQDTERNPGQDVVARGDPKALQFVWKGGGVAIVNVDARVSRQIGA